MSDDPMDVDTLNKPNIPGPGAEQEVEFVSGDLDGVFQSSGESDDHVSGEGTLPTGASDFIDWYPKPSQSYGKGHTFFNLFNSDENSMYCAKNPYYPFSGQKDWEIVSWLLHSGLSMGKIDSFLSVDMIKGLPLSFSSAKELRGRAEMLPSDPCWMSQVLTTSHPTKSPVVLYWVYTTAQCLCRVYLEWMTGDDAWNMQSALPEGATLLGTILSSNKTNISTMMGDRIAHPLLVGLVNISMSTQLKTSSNSFVLTALLPIPKFIHKNKHIYIVDTLEAMMLATVGGKISPVTMAMFKQFGDPFHHEPRTKSTTLAQLAVVQMKVDPSNIKAFFREAQKFRLNSVFKPFWQDWMLAEPSHFFTPEFLHLIHREFYDHDMKWMIHAVGDTEIDFRFSVLQPITRFLSAGAAPSTMITAVQVLMEFWYLIQLPHIDDDDIERISGALAEFHANKHAITAGGFCRSTQNKVINNWYIPKLELMQSIVPSICNTGVTMQWTADTTEHCRHFDLAMSLMDSMARLKLQDELEDANIDFDVDDDHDLPVELIATIQCPGYSHSITNYFMIAKILQHKEVGTVPLPLCTFVVGRMAFHLTYAPSIRSISIDDAAIKFGHSDLWPAIAGFLHHKATHGQNHIHTIGGARRAGANASLPFQKIQIWFKLRLQDTEFHDSSIIRPAQTLNFIVNNESGYLWPADGLCGHTVGQLRLIMRPVGKSNMDWSWIDRFLIYVHCFDGTTSARDPATRLHLIRRVKRSNGMLVGDIIPLTQIKAPVNLIPRFRASADNHLTSQNSMEHASEFWLNIFWDKNMFFPLSM
ncbi:hypothetical protein EDB19DRAFT_1830994 [Suillus lakei]|nr:hypothetical protein EDB19DRAFT_1830994 [Suillus lakei]